MDGCVVGWAEITLKNGRVGGWVEWRMFTCVDSRMKYRLAATVMGRWIGEELDNFIYVYHEVIWNFYQGQISILTQLRSTVSVCPIHPPCHDVRIQFYCFPVVFSHPHASCLFLPVSPRLPSPVIALISFTCPCRVFFTCLCSPNCI